MIGFKFGALTAAQSFRGTPPSIAAQNVLAKYFPAGSGEPIEVISTASGAGQVRTALAGTPGIASVTQPVTKDGPVLPAGDDDAISGQPGRLHPGG